MTHAEAFLRDIHDRPDDDAPRLIYADWLDEHGDPERAEFIRVQVALARAAPDDPHRPAWEARESELLTRNRARWRGPLGEMCPNLQMHRGFLRCTRINSTAFPVGDAGLQALLDAFQVAGQTLMTLDQCEVTDRGVEVLAASWQARGLETLVLTRNRIGSAGTAALAASPYLTRLQHLDFSGNALGDPGLRALLTAPAYRLVELTLDNTTVTAQGARVLADSPALADLQILSLATNPIGDEGTAALAHSPNLAHLHTLELSFCEIGEAGAYALAASKHLPRLSHVAVGGNSLGRAGLQALRIRFGHVVF